MAKLTILNLYNYDNGLFDGLVIPEQINKQDLINNILLDGGMFATIYTRYDFLKAAIEIWSKKMLHSWERITRTLLQDYNPLWNKEGTVTEEYNRTNTGSTTHKESGTDTNTAKAENKAKTAGYNSDVLRDAQGSEGTSENKINYGRQYTDSPNLNEHYKLTRTEGGNIGLTMSTQMLEAEIIARQKYQVINVITEDFINKFCIKIY